MEGCWDVFGVVGSQKPDQKLDLGSQKPEAGPEAGSRKLEAGPGWKPDQTGSRKIYRLKII